MSRLTGIFLRRYASILSESHFWIIICIVAVIAFFYYFLQFFRTTAVDIFPLVGVFVLWEYLHNLIGSLFYIPLLYSIAFLWWRGALIIWLLSTAIILPRIVYFYYDNFTRMFYNVFYLTIPLLVLAYLILVLRWRENERQTLLAREVERQNYLAQVFKAQEDERKRVAQEIHDDSIQRLAVVASDMQQLAQDKNLESLSGIKSKAESIKGMIISISQDLRRITLDLRPTVLDDLGMMPALRWLAEGFQKDTGINVHLEATGTYPQLSKKISVNVFRIVQEVLNNVRKHSQATQVTINLHFTDRSINIRVKDNGRGFSYPLASSELTAKGKLGIIGMQQRAQIIDGNISFMSDIGKGTIINFQCNIEE